jgi:hypothetical protein
VERRRRGERGEGRRKRYAFYVHTLLQNAYLYSQQHTTCTGTAKTVRQLIFPKEDKDGKIRQLVVCRHVPFFLLCSACTNFPSLPPQECVQQRIDAIIPAINVLSMTTQGQFTAASPIIANAQVNRHCVAIYVCTKFTFVYVPSLHSPLF